jgi:hypothetical protein
MLQSSAHSIGRNTQSHLPAAASGKILQGRDNIIAIISTLAICERLDCFVRGNEANRIAREDEFRAR